MTPAWWRHWPRRSPESAEPVGHSTLPPFELWIAAAAVYAGLSHFVGFLPASGPAKAIDLEFPRLLTCWSALYALGGAAMIAGLLRRSPRIEAAGVCLLGGGVAVALMATLAVGTAIAPTVVTLGGVVAACVARVVTLGRVP